jgi:hypothetical protein
MCTKEKELVEIQGHRSKDKRGTYRKKGLTKENHQCKNLGNGG